MGRIRSVVGLFFLILIFQSYSVIGQSRTHIGLVGGGNFSTVFFNHIAFSTNMRVNFVSGGHGGLMIKHFPYKRNNFFNTGIQLEVNYSQKGYSQFFADTLQSYNVRLNYITIPFSAIVYAGNDKLKFFFSPGIYAEFIQNATSNGTPTDDDPDEEFINVGPYVVFPYDQNTDRTKGFGMKAELGMFREFGFGVIHLAGEFNYTITNILDFGSRSSGVPDITNNIVVGFRVGYLIGLGKLEL